MSLLELKNIGKIYASNGAVAVGIRGVNLSFDRGEFVAITGESGSGKSTLLNVLSGMDTYEEGEMFVEGLPTSHYLQPEWEEFRKKYISFIFQDYNIIESFTVLQNVELSLMHIESKRERRARALELLRRVGLEKHIHQKGSKLSGGQKQRTVIARALAKDSPIILADEPTGNLDAQTSKEIIELLAEVSKDKLLIVVTHSFDEVENYATREIRVFDGAIESDRQICSHSVISAPITEPNKFTKRGLISNGFSLGSAIFRSKPILSLFMCLLLLVGTLGTTALSTVCGDAVEMFKTKYFFEKYDGRVVVTRRDGNYMPKSELEALASKFGAESYMVPDYVLDSEFTLEYTYKMDNSYTDYEIITGLHVYLGGDFGEDIIGRYPTAKNEVFLYIPLSNAQNKLDEESFEPFEATVNDITFTVVGMKTYRNTNNTPYMYLTSDGIDYLTMMTVMPLTSSTIYYEDYVYYDYSDYSDYYDYMGYGSQFEISLHPTLTLSYTGTLSDNEPSTYSDFKYVTYSADLADDEFMVASYGFEDDDTFTKLSETGEAVFGLNITMSSKIGSKSGSYNINLDNLKYKGSEINSHNLSEGIIISENKYKELYETAVYDEENGYYQVSFFFTDNNAAHSAATEMTDSTYIAVSSDTTRDAGVKEVIAAVFSGVFSAILWVLGVIFIAFFINICTSRTVNSFSGEMAIMRSMGIPVRIIKTGMYFRMIISAIPAVIITAIASYIVFSYPVTSAMFTYLEWYTYIFIFAGVFVIVTRVTKKQVKKLFGESVKKAIRGGRA